MIMEKRFPQNEFVILITFDMSEALRWLSLNWSCRIQWGNLSRSLSEIYSGSRNKMMAILLEKQCAFVENLIMIKLSD